MANESDEKFEDVTGKEWCAACGNHHDLNVRPTICHNFIILVEGIREMLESDDDDAAEKLCDICDEILGEETVVEDDDEEVFN
jgi:hypothetical protein